MVIPNVVPPHNNNNAYEEYFAIDGFYLNFYAFRRIQVVGVYIVEVDPYILGHMKLLGAIPLVARIHFVVSTYHEGQRVVENLMIAASKKTFSVEFSCFRGFR